MNKPKELNKALFAITILLYIIMLLVFAFWDNKYRKNQIIENIDSKLYNEAASLKYILPDDFHDKAIDQEPIPIAEDKYIANKLTRLIKETGFKYIYTIVKREGKLFFVASDIAADPQTKRGTFYLYPYEDADESFITAFERDTPTYRTVSDQWGTVRTVMIPEQSPGGIKYLACADVDISYVKGLLQKNMLRSITIILFFLLLPVPIIVIYRKSLNEFLAALQESEEKYRLLADNAADVIWTLDMDLNSTYTSPSVEKLLGYTAQEAKDKPLSEKMTQSSIEKINNVYMEELSLEKKGGADPSRSRSLELEQIHKDNSKVWVEATMNFIRDKDGKATGILGITRNISERKKAEKVIKEKEEKLVRLKKMESLGLLAGGVAHDLNNVLSGIVSYPELLLMDLPQDSKYRKAIETIQASGNRAAAIVQDLLTVARGAATTKTPLNLNDLVKEYLNSPEFKKLKSFHPTVTVKTNLDNDLFNIAGSPVHIGKTIMNLVSNASEAIEGEGNIAISTENRFVDRPLKGYDDVIIGEYSVLSISDDGPGIASNDLKRIFEPFYTKKVMGKSGTGLGLAVVWNVVKDHDGYIDVKSDEKGTTFDLYFPLTREDVSDRTLPLSVEELKGEGETILVVDDVESQRDISCNMLDILGYKPVAVSSGEDAVEYLKDNAVDLILLDMIMDPGINGRETYERIIEIHPNQKAVIISGFAESDDVREAQKLGAGGYVKKPVTLERLGLAVKDELENK